jgi:Flp pilus assembly pilin Flp
MSMIRKVLRDIRGVGSIEFALVASLISIAAIAGFAQVGGEVKAKFANVDQQVSAN